MTNISILTCVLGEPSNLHQTANSIGPWLSENLEWVIKFSDKTGEKFIENFNGPHIRHIKESDTSLYDAINQGLMGLNGDYYFVLGAGDKLIGDGMSALTEMLKLGNLDKCSYHAPIFMEASKATWTPEVTQITHGMSCPHPTSLLSVKKSLAIGGYDTTYKIAADYDHLSRYATEFGFGCALEIPPPVSFVGGGMSDVRGLESYLEVMLIRQRIWKAPDIRIYGDLLKGSANIIAQIIVDTA